MKRIINHIADFSSLGGIQTYLYSLCNSYPLDHKIYNISNKVLDIYNNKNKPFNYIYLFSFKFLFTQNKQTFVIHNLILSKKWLIIYLLLKIKRCEIIYHEHGIAWYDPIVNKSKYAKRVSKLNKIIVNSNATALLIRNLYEIKNELKVLRSPVIIYEELSEKKYSKSINFVTKKNHKIKIGFIGRLAFHKNPFFLIEVAELLIKKYDLEVELNFVGSGPLSKLLEKYCKENNINSIFFGRLENRRPALSNWNFCIVPSIREPLGLVPGEMALFDTLTFSSKVDGLKEMYPEECDILLIDMIKKNEANNPNIQYLPKLNKFDKNFYPDKEQCAEKIFNLNKNEILYKNLLEKHKHFIKSKFNISTHSRKLKSFAFNL